MSEPPGSSAAADTDAGTADAVPPAAAPETASAEPRHTATASATGASAHSQRFSLAPDDPARLAALCGPVEENLRHLEQRLGVHIRNRGSEFQVSGPPERVRVAAALLNQLYRETNDRDQIPPDLVHLYLQESGVEELLRKADDRQDDGGSLVIQAGRKSVQPRGGNQTSYVAAIRRFDVNFGIGPAGTGKTYLAVACAVEALEANRVSRILLVRPAVEAGEKLGFLPGDLAQKIDPYLRPLYDALYEMLGVERVNKFIERNVIEVAPLAYMRGRTLNNAFIILDESQNTTVAQMKMFLTRIGFGSTAVITGDITQIDLPAGQLSGLKHVMRVLANVEGIHSTRFMPRDVVRHPLVQKIVEAYDRYQDDPAPGADRAD